MAKQAPKRTMAFAADPGSEAVQAAIVQGAIEKTNQCICAKLRRLTRRVTQIYDRFLEPSGLTITQFGTLGRVVANGGSIGVGALADLLGTDPTTLSRNLKPLVRAGYVALARDRTDARRQLITVTGRGTSALRDAVPCWSKAQAHVASLVGSADFGSLLKRVTASLARPG